MLVKFEEIPLQSEFVYKGHVFYKESDCLATNDEDGDFYAFSNNDKVVIEPDLEEILYEDECPVYA